ncbi:hypothetical protein [Limosilactobacillus rudii]|nr:hypothetical protein [Limosilactobacillus rudii]MCD7134195.1 hypothetical protein [Limosilactobacillus rudii]
MLNTTPDIAGSASGVVNTFHQTGQSVSLAITVVALARMPSHLIWQRE